MNAITLLFKAASFSAVSTRSWVSVRRRDQQTPIVIDGAFQIQAAQQKATVLGLASFLAYSSPDLLAIGVADAYYVIECAECNLSASFLVPAPGSAEYIAAFDATASALDISKLPLIIEAGAPIAAPVRTFYLKSETDALLNSYLAKSGDLAGLASLIQARANLGLGNSATKNVGTGVGYVAAGNDARFQVFTPPSAFAIAIGGGAPVYLTGVQGIVPAPRARDLYPSGLSSLNFLTDNGWSALRSLGGGLAINTSTSEISIEPIFGDTAGTIAEGIHGHSSLANGAKSAILEPDGALTAEAFTASKSGYNVTLGANNAVGGFFGSAATAAFVNFSDGYRLTFGTSATTISDGVISLGRGDYRLNEVCGKTALFNALGYSVSLTAAITTLLTDYRDYRNFYFDTTAGNINQILPGATGNDGRTYLFFKASGDANTLTVSPATGQGSAVVLSALDSSVTFVAFNGKWRKAAQI